MKSQYFLTDADIYEHDKISRKTAGEGAGLYDSSGDIPPRFSPPSFEAINILRVSKVQRDLTASAQEGAPRICWKWTLRRKEVEAFFRLSEPIDLRGYVHEYDTAPCKIVGIMEVNGRLWSFSINGAAKAMLTADSERIYVGCSADACRRLVMWPHESGDE